MDSRSKPVKVELDGFSKAAAIAVVLIFVVIPVVNGLLWLVLFAHH